MSPHDISLPYGMKPREIAANLIANGYLPCPLQPRSKAITIPNWTNRIFEPEDFGSKSGVGIKTGNGLIAMDIDVYDEAISQKSFALSMFRLLDAQRNQNSTNGSNI